MTNPTPTSEKAEALPGFLNCPSCKAADIVSQPDRGGRSYSCPVCSRSVPLESVALRWHGELTSARAEVERLTDSVRKLEHERRELAEAANLADDRILALGYEVADLRQDKDQLSDSVDGEHQLNESLIRELAAEKEAHERVRAFLRRIPIVRRANEAPFSTCLGCGATDGDGCKPRCWVHDLDGLAETTPVGQGADHGVVAVAFLVRYGAMSDEALADLEDLLIDAYVAGAADPVESWRSIPPHDLVLHCPKCGKQHLDIGEFATRVHRKHLCENTPEGEKTGCGHLWVPFPYATRGVELTDAGAARYWLDVANAKSAKVQRLKTELKEERARREAAELVIEAARQCAAWCDAREQGGMPNGSTLLALREAVRGHDAAKQANPVEAGERCEECNGNKVGAIRGEMCPKCQGTGRRPPEPPQCNCEPGIYGNDCPVHGRCEAYRPPQEPTPAPASKAGETQEAMSAGSPSLFGKPLTPYEPHRYRVGFYELELYEGTTQPQLNGHGRWRWAEGSWSSLVPHSRVIEHVEEHARHVAGWLLPLVGQSTARAALDPTLQLIQLLGANGYAGSEPFRWAKEIQAALEKRAGGPK